jgi:hypothetical protein
MYGIDAERLVVWIEALDGVLVPRAGVLCRRHADAMVVPLGWMLDDRREAVPRLFKPRPPLPSLPASRPRRRAPAGRDETGQLALGVESDALPAAAASGRLAGSPDRSPAAPERSEPSVPWRPIFDQDDDLDGLLTARSPLLARAFGKRVRPKGA